MSISDRVSLAKSSRGSNLLSSLTPEQYAALFPKFYLKSLPDISGFLAAMTPEGKKKLENVTTEGTATPFRTDAQRRRAALDSALPLRRDTVPTSIRRLEERTGVKISDPGAKAQLSEEQRQVLELLKQDTISSDDPRLTFISKLSEEDRQQAGIETVKSEDGKTSFRMLPVEITRDEIEAEHKKATSKLESGNFNQQSPILMNRLMKDLNITREQAAGIIGNLAHESAGLQAGIQEKRPLAGRGGLGWAQWTGPRRRDFESYLERTGQSHTDPEANYGFLIEELKGKEKAALERLRRASSVDDATLIFERAYERAGIKHDEARRSYARRAMGLYDPETGTAGDGTPLTDEKIQEIENRLRKRRELSREEFLAEKTIPDLPPNIDPNFAALYGKMTPGQKQRVHESISKLGEGQDAIDKFNQLYSQNPITVVQKSTDASGNALLAQSSSNLRLQDGWITAQNDRNFNQCASLSKAFNPNVGPASTWKVKKDVPIKPGMMVASGDYGVGAYGAKGGAPGSGYHTGIALTAPDAGGNFLILDQYARSSGKAQVRKININSSQFRAGGIGVVEGARRSLHAVEMAKNLTTDPKQLELLRESAKEISEYAAELAPKPSESELRNSGQTSEQIANNVPQLSGTELAREERSTPEPTATTSPVDTTTQSEQVAQTNNEVKIGGVVVARNGEEILNAMNDPRVKAARDLAVRMGNPDPADRAVEKSRQAPDATPAATATPLTNTTPEQVTTATPLTNTTPVPVLADGGTVNTDSDSITAYPISDLKGDNSLVVDSKNKPLFTMNTNKESANFDPNTGNVTVNPESVNRNNPDDLTPPKETNSREEEQEQTPGVTQMSRSQPPISQSQPSDNSAIRERMIMSTVSPFTCPSFKRAISESNFKRTSSDGVGIGHFDQNNYSLK
jgi:hypothetical protein